VPLLANRFYPAGIERPPLVLLLSPYGRGVALDRMPQLLAERGYQVLYVSLRGTGGSGGEFDGFTIQPADTDGTLSWLRLQPWFGGALATWGASYLGFAQWELAAREIPEWKIAVIQDAPSEFAHQFMYPGGGFALGNALGWVQIVDRMFRAHGGTARQFLSVFTGPKAMRRAVATLPVADADVALIGRRARWFQEWIHHGPDEPYWQSSDHRKNVVWMPPVVYLQGGWYDFSPTMPRCGQPAGLSGCWSGRGGTGAASTPPWGCVTYWPRWTLHWPTAHHPRGVRVSVDVPQFGCLLLVPAVGPICLAGHRPPVAPPAICSRPAVSAPTRPPPALRAGFATTLRTRPRPSLALPSVWLPDPPTTGASKRDRMFLPSPVTPRPPIWR
jgi:hypothetical protein